MIVLNIGKELVRVESWDDIEGRPGFTVDLDPAEHALSGIIGQYVFGEKIRCGLSNCHTQHLRGYLITTKTGRETNIGKDCGKTYFGVDFLTMEANFDRDLREKLARENLWNLSLGLDELKQRCQALREGERGANWVYKMSRPLVESGRGVPGDIVRRISEMVKTGQTKLTRDRLATEQEIELARSGGARVPQPYYVTEAIADIRGLDALQPANDLRELLVVDLSENLKIFEGLEIDMLQPRELTKWSKWANSIDATLARAETATTSGQMLLTPANLRPFGEIVKDGAGRDAFEAYLATLG